MQHLIIITHHTPSWNGLNSALTHAKWNVQFLSPVDAQGSFLSSLESTVLLLDMDIPAAAAWEILEALSMTWDAAPSVPVYGLCAAAPGHDQVIRALNLGAEDLLSGDMNIELLLARLYSCHRRYFGKAKKSLLSSPKDHLQIDRHGRKVLIRKRFTASSSKGRNGASHVPVEGLTRKEFDLLYIFLGRPGHVWSRKDLLSVVWGSKEISLPRTVDKHVETLRGKLGKAGGFIVTVPGVGYKFTEEDV